MKKYQVVMDVTVGNDEDLVIEDTNDIKIISIKLHPTFKLDVEKVQQHLKTLKKEMNQLADI